MEEDIKVLEEFIEKNIKSRLRTEINANELQAIENLIKGYKELEKENERIKNIDYYKLAEEFEMGLYMPRCDVEEYYVPIENLEYYIEKSKVREKIEELRKPIKFKEVDEYGEIIEGTMIYQDKIEVLEELLQEGDK